MCVILEQFSYLKALKLNSNFYKFIFTHIVCINSSTSALISVCISKSSYLIAFLLIRLLFQCSALAHAPHSKTNQKTRAPIRCATKEQLNDPIRAALCISASLFLVRICIKNLILSYHLRLVRIDALDSNKSLAYFLCQKIEISSINMVCLTNCVIWDD